MRREGILLPQEEARDPNTSPERLVELAAHEDKEVRRAVAKHPNTPRETLFTLWADFPEALLENPVLPLLLLENPSFFLHLPPKTALALLGIRNLPHGVWEVLVQHPDTPLAVLEILAQDDVKEVRAAAEKNLRDRRKIKKPEP